MKKCKLFMLALCAVLFAACGGPKPSDTACKYLDYLKDGKYEDAAKLLKVADGATAEETVQLCQKMGAIIAEEGGIDKYEVVSEEIAEDGNTAVVKINITYKEPKHSAGNNDPAEFDMVKVDKKWYVDMTNK
ncbi:MAG: DUF4878 domain-containing protein [Bacteroidales bacterium]|nr:DUF4878 domain-containing protein [Bacteroidales bacterium]